MFPAGDLGTRGAAPPTGPSPLPWEDATATTGGEAPGRGQGGDSGAPMADVPEEPAQPMGRPTAKFAAASKLTSVS